MRRYLINSVLNMRDIGGYQNRYGKIIKQNMIVRSNCPTNLSDSDLNYTKSIGFRNIIDLRNIEELNKKPSSFSTDDYFNNYHIEIIGGRNIPDSSKEVSISYIKMLEDNEENFAKIFRVLKDANEGTIFFCNAGKDRTGVLTALIHMLLGVDDKDIIANYLLTRVYLSEFLENYIEKSKNYKLREIIIPREEFMEDFIKRFKEKYNSIDNYMIKIGITEDEIEDIRNKYLEDIIFN